MKRTAGTFSRLAADLLPPDRPGRTPSARPAGARVNVPRPLREVLDEVLISEAQLQRRIRALARQITSHFKERDLVVVSLLNGTVLFLADLIRELALPLRLDFIGVSSYREGTRSRELIFTKELRLDVQGRDVLLLDDILDTGRTLAAVLALLRKLRPRAIKTCVLLDKPSRRIEPVRADYVGFEVPDLFVVGYGLDFAEQYRNLRFIGVLKPHLYAERD
jgi:hypoxanthine phosphoribosyltransferase